MRKIRAARRIDLESLRQNDFRRWSREAALGAAIEPLEERRLLSSVSIVAGVLTINGNDTADTINVDPGASGKAAVKINGVTSTFDLSAFNSILVNANGGNDNVAINNSITKPARLLGGAGNDSLVGGGGNDTLDGQAGADTMKGGAGNDTVDYSSRTAGVTVGIGTLSDDGEKNEKDDVFTDVETILGGSGNDSLSGGAAANLLVGNGGSDTLTGNQGQDTLDGGAGADTGVNDHADLLISLQTVVGGLAARSVSVADSGVITITGSDDTSASGKDVVSIFVSNNSTPRLSLGISGPSGPGVGYQFPGNHDVIANLGAGDDYVEVIDTDGPTTGLHVTLNGGAGNDQLRAMNVPTTLNGNDGNDLLMPGNMTGITFDGGTGTNTFDSSNWQSGVIDLNKFANIQNVNAGQAFTYLITGNGADNLIKIAGANSRSTVLGMGGNDTIIGGLEADSFLGGDGNDSLIGNGGDDFLEGDAGNDTLEGDDGNDRVQGGDGTDTAVNSAGDQLGSIEIGGGSPSNVSAQIVNRVLTVNGTDGDDNIIVVEPQGTQVSAGGTMFAKTDFDSVVVNVLGGDDHIEINSLGVIPVSIVGGAGNDFVHLTGSSASVSGGDGNDTVSLDNSSSIPVFDGGAGIDELQFDGINFVDLSNYPTVENATANHGTIVGNGLDNKLSMFGSGTLLGGGGNDTLSGGIDADSLSGGEGNDSLLGNGGDDTLDGGAGSDFLSGGTGNDTVDYSSRTNGVSVGIGTLADDGEPGEKDNVQLDVETVLGGSGNDTIHGGASNNLLVGNSGNDQLFGNFGDDTLSGNAGTDILNGENGTDTAINAVGDTLVSIEVNGGSVASPGTIVLSGRTVIVTGTAGVDSVTLNQTFEDRPHLDEININMTSPGAAASGSFKLADFDTIQINIGNGNDAVTLSEPFTFDEPLTMNLGDGEDTVNLDHIGSDAGMTINGGVGNDTMNSTESFAQFNGDDGTDSIVDSHFDPFAINLMNMPTTENASIRLGTLTGNNLDNILTTQFSGFNMSGNGGNDTLTVGEESPYGVSNVDGGDGNDMINGGTGELTGDAGNDTITGDGSIDGGAGNDTLTGKSLFGGDDDDTLIASSVASFLAGGPGNDTLLGGMGDDTLDGGTGADLMKGGDGNDTVDYSSRTNGVYVGIGSVADDGEPGEKDNVNFDVETVLGGSGNDTIHGGAANNLLVGNGGNDQLFGNFGDDTLSGNAGTDTLNGENGTDTAINFAADVLVSIEKPVS